MGGCVGPVWSDSLWSPCDPFSTVSSGRVDSHEAAFPHGQLLPGEQASGSLSGRARPHRALGAGGGRGRARRALATAAMPGPLSPPQMQRFPPPLHGPPGPVTSGKRTRGGGDDGPPGAVAVRPEPSRAVREGWLLPLPRPWGRGGELDFQRNFFGNIKHSDNFSRLRVWHIRLCQTDAVCDGTIVISGRACVAEGAVSGVRMQTCPRRWRAGLGKHRCSGTPAGASPYLKQGALSPSGWGAASRGSFRA